MKNIPVYTIVKTVVCVVVATVIIILLSTTCSNYKKYQREVSNREALMDSVHTLESTNGSLIQYKKAYELTSKEYADYMNVTNKEIRELEKKLKSAVSQIVVLEGRVKIDTIHCTDSVYLKNDTTCIHFGYNDEWITIGGLTEMVNGLSFTTIDSIVLPTPVKVGFTKDNNVFVTSSNPYIRFTTVEGATSTVNKRKKHSLGLQVGVGPMAGYDPISKQFVFSFGVYCGIGYGFGLTW